MHNGVRDKGTVTFLCVGFVCFQAVVVVVVVEKAQRQR